MVFDLEEFRKVRLQMHQESRTLYVSGRITEAVLSLSSDKLYEYQQREIKKDEMLSALSHHSRPLDDFFTDVEMKAKGYLLVFAGYVDQSTLDEFSQKYNFNELCSDLIKKLNAQDVQEHPFLGRRHAYSYGFDTLPKFIEAIRDHGIAPGFGLSFYQMAFDDYQIRERSSARQEL